MFSNCCSVLCQKQNPRNPVAPIKIKKPDTLPLQIEVTVTEEMNKTQLPNDHKEKD